MFEYLPVCKDRGCLAKRLRRRRRSAEQPFPRRRTFSHHSGQSSASRRNRTNASNEKPAAKWPPSHRCPPARRSAATESQRPGMLPTLVAQQPPSRRTGEQETAAGPPQLSRSKPPTYEKREAKPLKTSQTVTGTEALERRNPQTDSACPKNLGQPHPAPPNAFHGFRTKFPDWAIWVWERKADRWPRIIGRGGGGGYHIHYTVRRLM